MASLPEFGIPDPVRICEPCYVKQVETKSQYQKSAPLPVTPPEHAASPTPSDDDSELALAIKLSLQESKKESYISYSAENKREPAVRTNHRSRQDPAPTSVPVPLHEAEEEKMLKAAIEASLKDAMAAKPQSMYNSSASTSVMTDLEHENVKLFSQLVDRLSLTGGATIEPEIEALAISMEVLRDTLKTTVYELRQNSPELAGMLATLEISLAKYQLLKSLPKPRQGPMPSISANPIQPTLNHAALPYHSYPSAPQHYPQGPYQAYTGQVALAHNIQQHQQAAPVYAPRQSEDNGSAQLLDEEPLIEL